MNSKVMNFTGNVGRCIVPVCSVENMHEFGLYDKNGNEIMTSMFHSLEYAKERAMAEFPDRDYYVRDLTEEWYVKKALAYRKQIKKLHPNFRLTNLILDMSQMYYSRLSNEWYTFIPFEYNGVRWAYRENPAGDWIHKISNQI